VIFKKKQLINKAIIKFDDMTPEKKKKVARLLGLPVSDDSKEEAVYNQVDNLLKQTEFKNGKYQGLNPIEVFNRFADMKENLLHIKDLVKQAVAHSVYRLKPNGKVYEGEFEIAKDEDELVKFLADDDNQDQLLILEGKLKGKKIASI
jgi:CO dehydrogenase/acetyl-CoA synthase gamma subunit (corrinoid Fe-S protein)